MELKFRACDLSGEYRMLTVKQLSWEVHPDGILRLHFCGSADGYDTVSWLGLHSGFGAVDGSEGAEWILMKYTEQKDKNGKEIYDDDIMRKPTGQTYMVRKQRYSCGGLGILGYKDMSQDEIIGNVHENPERDWGEA